MSFGSFIIGFTLIHFSYVFKCIFNVKVDDPQLMLLVSVYIHVLLNGLMVTRV